MTGAEADKSPITAPPVSPERPNLVEISVPQPASPLRIIWLMACLGLRRKWNLIAAQMSRKKKKPDAEGKRKATPGKKRSAIILWVILGPILLFQCLSLSSMFLGRLGKQAEERRFTADGQIITVGLETYAVIKEQGQYLRGKWSSEEEYNEIWKKHGDKLWQALWTEVAQKETMEGRTTDDLEVGKKKAERLWDHFHKNGAAGFRPTKHRGLAVLIPSWPEAEDEALFIRGAALLLLCLGVCVLLSSLGSTNQDLGRVEWSMEFLFTLPVSSKVLFTAKSFEYVLGDFYTWLLTFPFLLAFFLCAGLGWGALPISLAAAAGVGLMLGAVRAVTETWLRIKFSVFQLKNIQAACTFFGILSFFFLLWVVMARPTPMFFLDWAAALPSLALWNPFSMPALLFQNGGLAWLACVALTAWTAVLTAVAIGGAARFVRDGLVVAGGPYQGTRQKPRFKPTTAKSDDSRPLLHGIVAKELRLLVRDKNFLMQTLVVPVLVLGFQVMLNPNLVRGAAGNLQHAAALGFGLGTYALIFSAFNILVVEGQSLWLLYTFPRDLNKMLLQKTFLWCGFAVLYVLLAIAATTIFSGSLDLRLLDYGVTAVVGVVIYAFIAAALGVMGSDPLATEPKKRIRPEMAYLYLLLASFFGYALYAPSPWGRLVQMVLSTLAAMALWQKVRDRLPYLLDPTDAPPPRISLSDGLIAALAFFVLQGLLFMILHHAELPLGAALMWAFSLAGILTALFAFYIFWRSKVPNLFVSVGLRRDPNCPSAAGMNAVPLGLLAGLAAAGFGILYLWSIEFIPPLRELKAETLKAAQSTAELGWWWLAGLTVVAAPFCEEFIFRGLIHRGLRRSFGVWPAVLASAAIFAVVHQPLSVIPVFGLGMATAICFERSGLLVAPIIAHMVYNAIILSVSGG
jgi:hypothetical protein